MIAIAAIALVTSIVDGLLVDEVSYREGFDHGETYASVVASLVGVGAGDGVSEGQIRSACTSAAKQLADMYDVTDYADGCFDGAVESLSN